MVRGVLFDKLAALSLMLETAQHPSVPGLSLSPFESFPKKFPAGTIVGILSDLRSYSTDKWRDSKDPSPIAPNFNINLRNHSLFLLKQRLSGLGSGVELKDFFPFSRYETVFESSMVGYLEARLQWTQVDNLIRSAKSNHEKIGEAKLDRSYLEDGIQQLRPEIPKEWQGNIEDLREKTELDQIHSLRDRLRQAYLGLFVNYFLHPNEAEELNDRWSSIEKLKKERYHYSKAYTFSPQQKHLIVAKCRIDNSEIETATCGLIRGPINDLEDKLFTLQRMQVHVGHCIQKAQGQKIETMVRGRKKEIDLIVEAWVPDALKAKMELRTRIGEWIQDVESQLGNEKAILDDMLKLKELLR
jgi:hypothetical protein